jgi:hypothetical protein
MGLVVRARKHVVYFGSRFKRGYPHTAFVEQVSWISCLTRGASSEIEDVVTRDGQYGRDDTTDVDVENLGSNFRFGISLTRICHVHALSMSSFQCSIFVLRNISFDFMLTLLRPNERAGTPGVYSMRCVSLDSVSSTRHVRHFAFSLHLAHCSFHGIFPYFLCNALKRAYTYIILMIAQFFPLQLTPSNSSLCKAVHDLFEAKQIKKRT